MAYGVRQVGGNLLGSPYGEGSSPSVQSVFHAVAGTVNNGTRHAKLVIIILHIRGYAESVRNGNRIGVGNAVVGKIGSGVGASQCHNIPVGIVFHAGCQTVRAVKVVVYGGNMSHCVQVRGAAA